LKTKDIVLIALFTALIIALGLVPPIPMPLVPVPLTLQTFGVMLAGLILGPKRAGFVLLLYVMLAVLGGIVAVLAVVLLAPSAEQSDVASSPSELGSWPIASPSLPAPTPSVGVTSRATVTSPPLTPSNTLGDFVLVHVPARDGAGSREVAVLERDGDTWVVRETYPESVTAGNETG
jgi:hypothetical protein